MFSSFLKHSGLCITNVHCTLLALETHKNEWGHKQTKKKAFGKLGQLTCKCHISILFAVQAQYCCLPLQAAVLSNIVITIESRYGYPLSVINWPLRHYRCEVMSLDLSQLLSCIPGKIGWIHFAVSTKGRNSVSISKEITKL